MTLHSATRINAYHDCPRKGAFHYYGAQYGYSREPVGDAIELGRQLHKFAEDYLKTGKQPDRLTVAGEMFIAGLPYLPPPRSGGVEGEGAFRLGGLDFTLFLDYRGPLPGREGTWLLDHKTSSNPKLYGLWQKHTTGEGYAKRKGFLDDVQAVLYSAWQLTHSEEEFVQLCWLYYGFKQTKGEGGVVHRSPPFTVTPSYCTLSAAEIDKAVGDMLYPRALFVEEIESKKPDPLSLDPNPGHCHAYGKPCFYTNVCNLSAAQRLFGIRTTEKVAMTDTNTNPANGPKLSDLMRERREAAMAAKAGKAAAAGTAAPAPAKPDLVNPPEKAPAPAPVAPAPEQKPAPEPARGTVLRSVPTPTPAPAPIIANGELRAITVVVARRLADALNLIAVDLSK